MAQVKQQPTADEERTDPHSSGNEEAGAEKSSLALAVEVVTQAAEAGADFAGLLSDEVKLAFGDALRLVVLYRVFIHLLVFAWLGLSVCVAWIVYESVAYGPVSALVFCLLQLVGLFAVLFIMRSLKKTLSLPQTRAQLNALLGDNDEQSQATAK